MKIHSALANGTIVQIGPAYRMGGTYTPDGCEGTYTVIAYRGASRAPLSGAFYLLVCGVQSDATEADVDLYLGAVRVERGAAMPGER